MEKEKMKKQMTLAALLGAAAILAGCGNRSGTGKGAEFDTNQAIVPYTRDTNSGTREGFMEKIGFDDAKKSDNGLKKSVQQVTSNGDMLTQLENQKYGVGYFSFDSATEAKKGGLKILNFEGVAPADDVILNGTYQLARNFNYCIANETDATKKLIVTAFVAYMQTQEGLAIIKSNGGTVDIKASTPTWDSVKANYAGIDSDHSTVTINFGGSTSVEKIAKALSSAFAPLAGNFKPAHAHTGSGDAYKNTQGAQAGTDDIAFASREFKLSDGEPLAEGTYGRICVDGIVVGVSRKNPMTNITAAQAKSIYDATSSVTKWADLIPA